MSKSHSLGEMPYLTGVFPDRHGEPALPVGVDLDQFLRQGTAGHQDMELVWFPSRSESFQLFSRLERVQTAMTT